MEVTPGIRAIRAWLRLQGAINAFNRDLQARYGVNGLELAMLRIVAERSPIRMLDLRRSLALHPATLGQAIDRLVKRGLLERGIDPDDRRGRVVALTGEGRRMVAEAPAAGAVRLRHLPPDERIERLAESLTDAVELFGLESWTDKEET
jgi:DNA-binding MarR family transcriptional regulator